MDNNDKNMQDCIEMCNICRDECEKTLFQYCLETGGEHAGQSHVRLMMDCIEMCQTAARFMVRGSELHEDVCGICAQICEACAASCEAIADSTMLHCAEICRRCATSCEEMKSGMIRMGGSEQSSDSLSGAM